MTRECPKCRIALLEGPTSTEVPIEWACPSCGDVLREEQATWRARQPPSARIVDLMEALKVSLATRGPLAPTPGNDQAAAEAEAREGRSTPYEMAHSHFDRWKRHKTPEDLEQAEHYFLRVEQGEEPQDDLREELRTDACLCLGEIAVAKERPVQAARWFRKAIEAEEPSDEPASQLEQLRTAVLAAAEAGHPEAQSEVAEWFLGGVGVPRDSREGATWLERAAAQGFALAMYRLGELYERGEGVARDAATANLFYRRAAEAGQRDAQYRLWCMEEGNSREALHWLERAAALDHLDAMVELVDMSHIGCVYGGVAGGTPGQIEWFLDGALPLLQRSAVRGHARAQYLLSMWYGSGTKVHPAPMGRRTPGRAMRGDDWHAVVATPEDEQQALYWLRRSARQRDPGAETELGQRYRDGQGVEPDERLAMEWLRRGAIHGEDEARLALAYLLSRKDNKACLKEAAYWFLRVATSNDALPGQVDQGRYWFGYVCEFGRGMEQRDGLAFRWYLQAAEGSRLSTGHPEARDRLDALCRAGRGLPGNDWVSSTELLFRASKVGAISATEALGRLMWAAA